MVVYVDVVVDVDVDVDGVQATLESVNVRGVFAAGDVCDIVDHPRPKGESERERVYSVYMSVVCMFVWCVCVYVVKCCNVVLYISWSVCC